MCHIQPAVNIWSNVVSRAGQRYSFNPSVSIVVIIMTIVIITTTIWLSLLVAVVVVVSPHHKEDGTFWPVLHVCVEYSPLQKLFVVISSTLHNVPPSLQDTHQDFVISVLSSPLQAFTSSPCSSAAPLPLQQRYRGAP